jgi:hypothetical protein
MEIFPTLLLFTCIVLVLFIFTELLAPGLVTEGFSNLPRTSYWSTFVAPRSDIGPDQEDPSYIRDPRYFNDYTDVTRIGVSYDFCRILASRDTPDEKFFACALAGTDNLDSTKFRTASTKDGFRLSMDDYMRDMNGDGRADYCRILKWKDGSYQPICNQTTDLGFESKEVVDSDPPKDIQTLLRFYDGCVLWLRFMNNMNDYVDNVKVNIAGQITIDETVRQDKETKGLEFTGGDQFLRISDTSDLSLGNIVPLRSIRSWMIWAYFDEFTNNAKLFDFGNGAGRDNVFLGIYRKGDSSVESEDLRPLLCGGQETLPEGKTGAQPVEEVTPQELMKTTDANVDEFSCTGIEVFPRRLQPSFPGTRRSDKVDTGKATLLFEVWDKQARKMSIKVPSVIPKKKWVHICITAMNDDAFRPDIAVYINGKKVMEKESGWLPATSTMTNCYIGKSNWANDTSTFENRDELFKGRIFDFRAYRKSLKADVIEDSYEYGREKLGL